MLRERWLHKEVQGQAARSRQVRPGDRLCEPSQGVVTTSRVHWPESSHLNPCKGHNTGECRTEEPS